MYDNVLYLSNCGNEHVTSSRSVLKLLKNLWKWK